MLLDSFFKIIICTRERLQIFKVFLLYIFHNTVSEIALFPWSDLFSPLTFNKTKVFQHEHVNLF